MAQFFARSIARAGLAVAAFAALVPTEGLRAAPVAGAGVWTLARTDAPRACRLTLREDSLEAANGAGKGADAGGRRALGAPAACRKALPILAQAEGWEPIGGGRLALFDRQGAPLLDFAPAAGGGLEADGPQGERYRLTAQTRGVEAPAGLAAASGGFATRETTTTFATRTAQAGFAPARQAPGAKPAAAPAPTRASVAGRYAVLREEGRDTGCMVTLDDKPGRGGKGQSAAALAPACRDHGIVIFDPIGWTLAGHRLTLHARKGHSITLAPTPGGTWAREGAEGGKPLSLRRI